IGSESRDRSRKVAKQIGKLSTTVSFIDVSVPAADFGKCNLKADSGLDQLCDLHQRTAEWRSWVNSAVFGLILGRICLFQEIYRLKCFLSGRAKAVLGVLLVEPLESACHILRIR